MLTKVEAGVQVVQRWILVRLRHQRFFSLAELNSAIAELVEQLNDRMMRGWGRPVAPCSSGSTARRCCRCCPAAYEYAEWRRCRVRLNTVQLGLSGVRR